MIQRKGTANGFTTYNNQFLLNAGTHRWSDGASTTKHSFVSQRMLDGRWPPAVLFKTADCKLLFACRVVFVINCPSYPPLCSFLYDHLQRQQVPFLLLFKVQTFEKMREQSFIVLTQLWYTTSMICWSCVLETDFNTHTHNLQKRTTQTPSTPRRFPPFFSVCFFFRIGSDPPPSADDRCIVLACEICRGASVNRWWGLIRQVVVVFTKYRIFGS